MNLKRRRANDPDPGDGLNTSAQQRLKEMVDAHGQRAWSDPNISEGLLRDYLPGLERERHGLYLGVRVEFPQQYVAAHNPTRRNFAMYQALDRLHRQFLVSEAHARWIVDAWSSALPMEDLEGDQVVHVPSSGSSAANLVPSPKAKRYRPPRNPRIQGLDSSDRASSWAFWVAIFGAVLFIGALLTLRLMTG